MPPVVGAYVSTVGCDIISKWKQGSLSKYQCNLSSAFFCLKVVMGNKTLVAIYRRIFLPSSSSKSARRKGKASKQSEHV